MQKKLYIFCILGPKEHFWSSKNYHVVNYLFSLQLNFFLSDNLVYLHRRAFSSQPTHFQVLKIKTIKTTNSENKDELSSQRIHFHFLA